MTEIKPGDIVRLKSGGPDMTADEINYTNRCRFCHYFNDSKQLTTVQIKEELLDVVTNKDGKSQPQPGIIDQIVYDFGQQIKDGDTIANAIIEINGMLVKHGLFLTIGREQLLSDGIGTGKHAIFLRRKGVPQE